MSQELSTTLPLPRSVFISVHHEDPTLFTVGVHLPTGPVSCKQYNTPYMRWPEVEILLQEWHADPAEFLLRHFDWDRAAMARQVAAKGPSTPTPYKTLSLADLGL